MKKIIAALTALMLCGTMLTACGEKTGDNEETTVSETTTAAETTAAETTAAETETETEAETEAAPYEGDNSMLTPELEAALEILDKETPVYANYLRESTKLPVCNAFAYDTETENGTEHVEMSVTIVSSTRAVVNTVTDSEAMDIIMDGNKYYIVMPKEKAALYMTIPDEDLDSTADDLKSSMVPEFDASKAVYELGEGEVNGETLPYEKVTTEDGTEICFYYEAGTMDIKYLVSDGIIMEMTVFTHDVDESIFEIPADYEITDLSDSE